MKSRIAEKTLLIWIILLLAWMISSGCSAGSETAPPNTPTPSPSSQPLTATPTTTSTDSPSATVTRTPYALSPTPFPGLSPFSPLKGIAVDQLPGLITNKYSPPAQGSDQPHQGVDFSILDEYSRLAVEGNPVQAVLDGRVAAVIQDRFPYGNTILIETRLDRLSPAFLKTIPVPTPGPIQTNHAILTCPELDPGIIPDTIPQSELTERSFYLLYAHLQEPSSFQPGDLIASQQIIGTIGTTGNALNPHLHLELRVGPMHMLIPSMAHYDASASPEEMAFYCLWRVSGLFQLIDPMILFSPLDDSDQ